MENDSGPPFRKQLPGADCVFQPEDLGDYANDAWDIRISIGSAPLEEAFYYTIEDPQAVDRSIVSLLTEHALNPANAGKLDVADYPDLPYIQTEINLYLEKADKGLLELAFYANNAEATDPVDINSRAREYLSVCTYHDGSLDYRVLDLVLLPRVPEIRSYDQSEAYRNLGHIYLLLLIDHWERAGDEAMQQFMDSPPVQDYVERRYDTQFPHFVDGMKRLDFKSLIETKSPYATDDAPPVALTKAGRLEIEALKSECAEIARDYDCYDSCTIEPPALGVPGGFDVRVQMLEFEGKDIERSVLLRVLEDVGDAYFSGNWAETFENLSFYNNVRDALAYKTNFSREALQSLQQIARSGQ